MNCGNYAVNQLVLSGCLQLGITLTKELPHPNEEVEYHFCSVKLKLYRMSVADSKFDRIRFFHD